MNRLEELKRRIVADQTPEKPLGPLAPLARILRKPKREEGLDPAKLAHLLRSEGHPKMVVPEKEE
jgi:hypothetical protein